METYESNRQCLRLQNKQIVDKELIQKINDLTKDSPIFYITNDAERALGLEKLLENFHIVCIDQTDMVDYMEKDGVKIFCLEKELGKKNTVFRNSAKLLKHELTKKYINEHKGEGGYAMTFKTSSAFKMEAEKLGLKLLNTEPSLNRKFENKISQYESLSNADINFPETIISELEKLNYEELTQKLGEFVVQFDRGHTGSGTVFIKHKEVFDKLVELFPKRTVRVSKKIEGEPYTLNCVITSHGVLLSGLSYQITGVEGLTSQEGGTVGNDFSYPSKLSSEIRVKIKEEAEKIALAMSKDSYLGFFGIDFIVSEDQVYIIEVNARQPASVSYFNKLQIKNSQTPASLYHVASFLGLDFEIDANKYSDENTKSLEAGQVFLRNTREEPFTVNGDIKTGVYRLQSDNSAMDWDKGEAKENTIFLDEDKDKPLIYNEEEYSVETIDEGGFLILTQAKEKEVNTGNELARIQALQRLVDDKGSLLGWAKHSLLAIKNYLI